MVRKLHLWLVGGVVALGGLGVSAQAQAGSNVYWSVGVSTPGVVGMQVGNVPPVVVPQPMYVSQPVYVSPPPVYQPLYYPAPVRVHSVRPKPPKPVYRSGSYHKPRHKSKSKHKPKHRR